MWHCSAALTAVCDLGIDEHQQPIFVANPTNPYNPDSAGRRPADLVELSRRHEVFLLRVCDRALLSARASSVLDIILSSFDQIHELRALLADLNRWFAFQTLRHFFDESWFDGVLNLDP